MKAHGEERDAANGTRKGNERQEELLDEERKGLFRRVSKGGENDGSQKQMKSQTVDGRVKKKRREEGSRVEGIAPSQLVLPPSSLRCC